jgi:hypothetical protein
MPGLSLCLRLFPLADRNRAMVIAVIAMGMVQGSLVKIVLMIAVGNERMPTILMPARAGDRRALGGILRSDLKHMLIVMPLVRGVKVPFMQVIDMILMGKRNMPTMLSMDVGMLIVNGMAHMNAPFKAVDVRFLFQSIARRTNKINYKFIKETSYHLYIY